MLIAYPEAQRKAQQEIDEIVGSERPPTLDDIPKLKYMNAVIEEVRRCSLPTIYTTGAHLRQVSPL